MKTINLLIAAILMIASFSLTAQVAITTDGSSADGSAMLDVKSTTKGLLPPRMTDTQRDAISSPVAGLIIFNSTTAKPNYYDGTSWMNFDGTSAASPSPSLSVGDYYQGGVIFYLDGIGSGLICAVNDQNGGSGIQWYNGSSTVTGATGIALGTGQANTTAIISNQGLGSYAASVCDSYTVGGYNDWFLPSKNELNEMINHKAVIEATATANGGAVFGNGNFWSSTEYSSTDAWGEHIDGSSQTNIVKYGTLKVRAIRTFNYTPSGTGSTTVPGAPTIGTATPGNGQASVSFTAPASDGGSTITSYIATSSPGGITGTLNQAGSGTIIVTGLTNGIAYTFTITATNAIGTSTASAVSNSVTPVVSFVPGAPTLGTATAGYGMAILPFTAPASDGGSTITSYTATSSPGGITATKNQAGSGTFYIYGLTNGIAYTFTVTATNAIGTGPASAASNSVTPATTPGAPTIGTATAGNGQASVSFTAPVSDGGSTITSYTATSYPDGHTGTLYQAGSGTITVTGLTNGTAYAFTVTASNAIGIGDASAVSNSVTTVGSPDVPTIGTATAGNGQASVPFTAPASDGGSTITSYTATSYPEGHTGTLNQAGSGTIIVTGLTSGTAYTFTVTATNAIGTGPASAASNSVTPVSTPGAPTIGTATAGNGWASVSFTAPASDGGSTITSYTATSDPGGHTGTLIQSGSGTVTVTGLTNGTAYTFTVTATSAFGTGPASAASNSVTPATLPGAPTIGTATAGNGQTSVSFTAPAFDGGSTITSYTATSSPGGITGTLNQSGSGTIIVTGLTNGITYLFSVTATNASFTGPQSNWSNSVTPATVPGAPTIGTATAGNGQAYLYITAPASDGGSIITLYTATSDPEGHTGTLNQAGNNIYVTGLTNGTAYTFTVTATNALGTGPASAASNSVTPATTPGAPTIGTAIAGNGQASISFTAPASDGGSTITSYTATSYPEGHTGTLNQAGSGTITVTGLTNGTTYTFSITATNVIGTGPASAASNSVTPANLPGAPTIGTATPGNGQASVPFTAPVYNGESTIISYTATSDPEGHTGTLNQSGSGTITVTGLTNGTAYTFTVTATNATFTGPQSNISNIVIPANLPGAPTIGTATAGNGQASISFTAPASDGGSIITSYTATSDPGGHTGTLNQSGSGTISVTGLTIGTAYTFTVTATNAIGTGPASAVSNSVTPSSSPGAPTIGTATAGNGYANVPFTAPASNGGSTITSYTATSDPGGHTGTLNQAESGTITVTGLTNGTAYTFTVTATSAIGTGPASAASNSVTFVIAPGAPTIGTATAGNGQASVPFTAPASDGGSTITSYTATSDPEGHTGTLNQAGSGTITVTGLTNGTAYTFTVTATNAIGTGALSAVSNSVTPATLPGAPTIGTITAGNGQASVPFTAPASDGGSTITSYTATSDPEGHTGTLNQAGSGTITVTGLTNGTAYTFTVAATNAIATGPASAVSNSVTFVIAPGAPTIGTATAGNGQASVSFTAPASDGGSTITSYTATSDPEGHTGTLNQAGSGTITVTGLTNGTAYTFTVTATSAIGTGLASAASNSVTPATPPSAPTIGTATAGYTYVILPFTAPASDGGSTITSYTATSDPGGHTGTLNQSGSGTIIVTGLTNGTAYSFTVTATNVIGTGPASAASNSVTPANLPGAPTIGTVTPGNGQASVPFTAPVYNGESTIISYTATSDPEGHTGTLNQSGSGTITVTGLTNGTAYTFTVTATNATFTGPQSNISNIVIPANLPGAPTIGAATAGNGQASISFTAPASDGGSIITSYTATSSPGSITGTLNQSGSGTITVTGLTNETAYTFTVAATNAIGTGPTSAASTSVTPVGSPGSPTIGTATVGNGQASVPFTAPASDGGSSITSYTATSYPEGHTGTLNQAGSGTITVTGLTNGTAYTFTVTATNAIGTGPASAASNSVTPVGSPGAPTIGTATAGNSYAYVPFTAPATDGGSTISSYTATSYPEGHTGTLNQAGSGTITVTGLTNGTAYTFIVTATNAIGTGPASAASNSVTPATLPGIPTIGTATAGNNGQAWVSFTAPASDGGSPITLYTATSDPEGHTGTLNQTGSGTIIVTGLSNGTAYTFTVTATNAIGTGPASAASNSVNPATTPGVPTPTIGTATAGNGQASVSFTAPASYYGTPITSYTATSFPEGHTGTLNQGGSGFITVTGLSNGTAYTFYVTATTAIGTGPASAVSNSVTPTLIVPGAPIIGTATAGNGQASVSFTAPVSDGGSTISSYTATSSPGNITGTLNQAGSGIITVTGLTNGTAYTFTVTATNAIGMGAASAASNSVTPATPPDAPTIGTVTAGNGQASVPFTAPASDGGSTITSYTATSSPGSITGTLNQAGSGTITVTGLSNGTAYIFTVTATNAIGTGAASAVSNSVTSRSIGDYYQGGVIFYLDGSGGGLICAVSDQDGGSGIQWYNGSYIFTEAAGTTIGTGQANTTAIITIQGAGSYAAKVCDNYIVGGYSDWFLPSKDELNEMYLNYAAINATATANGGVAFFNTNYWSSSDYDTNNAYGQYIVSGQQYIPGKWTPGKVRAVRAF